ncbi:MAG: efflux RND transporter periplasmic adaptor subunit [Proteobacteria bacterium]|nr:efflux RND transporter periplasmic adaptor subunit [Pseudomonadota bacterium]
MIQTRALLFAGLLVLAACNGGQKAPGVPALPHLDTFTVRASGVGQGRTWDGVVEAVQQADLSAQTAGRVVAVDADVNDRVAAGAVLLRLTAVEQQAGADVARAQLRAAEAAAAEAQATFARYSALAARQLVSRLQIDQLRAARDSAVAARDAARAQLAQAGQQADYTVVRAPFAGIVSARRVEPGESLAPGQALMSLYAPGALRIEVQVPQSDADAIRAHPRASVLLADGRSVDAAGVTVFPSADPATHSVNVRVVLPALKEPLQPGATAKVMFANSGSAGALQVPRAALVQRGEVSGVYVLEGNRLSLRQLRVGQRAGDQVEVLAGLKDGETVASDPVAALQALAAQRKAAGHAGE